MSRVYLSTHRLAGLCLLLLPAGAAYGQQPSFAPMTAYSTGLNSRPIGVAVADMNGDGKPDIVVVSNDSCNAGVLRGQGGGSFGPITTYTTARYSHPYGMALADMNGDSRPDLVTVNHNYGTSVLLGQPNGGFGPVTAYPISGVSARGVAIADLNGDGRPDIVTANFGYNSVGVLTGLANGFSAATYYSVGSGGQPFAVKVADVNNDDQPDIVTANYDGNSVAVLLGLGGGSFAPVALYSTGNYSQPVAVAVADVNGDGRADLITANHFGSSVSVLLGRASGGFDAPVSYSVSVNSQPYAVAVADVNGDNRPDIMTGNFANNSVGVLMGRAGGFGSVTLFPTSTSPDQIGPFSLVVTDVNGDQRPDIVVANTGDSVGVFLNTDTTPLATAGAALAAGLSVQPNPAHQQFSVTLPGVAGATQAQVELHNALGQVVRHYAVPLPGSGTSLTIPAEGLAAGLYMLRLAAGPAAATRRVLLE